MQKQLFGAVLTSTFLLVASCGDEKKIPKGVDDPMGTPSSLGEMRLQDNGDDPMGTPSSLGEIKLQDNGDDPMDTPSCEMRLQANGKFTEYAIISPSPCTDIDTKKGPFTVTCKIENFTQDKADGKSFWISIEDVKQAKHWPKFPVEDEQCPPNSIQEGINDSGDKREINILLLRIDHDTDQKFHRWMEEGHRTGYPGLPLNQSDIVATVPIFIP